VVHFHGYDISSRSVLTEFEAAYQELFRDAAGLVVVSEPMRQCLKALGAPPDKIYYNPYGVDCRLFCGAAPAASGPILLAVGRFVEKKAPQMTISAFAIVHREYPEAQLRMIGYGPLLEPCRDLVSKLGLENAVHFLGSQPPEVVISEMRQARAFVQHSIEASDGDSEGLPNSILEAGATGLPVVATRHAGIPEAVLHGETGLLVAEGDVEAMAREMLTLLRDSELADRFGENARKRISTRFSRERSIAGLWSILSVCADLPDAERYRSPILVYE
jgi:glycosyltransferase involved in cell wall biosynthesis